MKKSDEKWKDLKEGDVIWCFNSKKLEINKLEVITNFWPEDDSPLYVYPTTVVNFEGTYTKELLLNVNSNGNTAYEVSTPWIVFCIDLETAKNEARKLRAKLRENVSECERKIDTLSEIILSR